MLLKNRGDNSNTRPRIIVAQLGARMHYAVPVLLQRAGMLAHFYTDTYVGRGSAWHSLSQAASLLPEAWRPQVLKKLLGRQENGLPPNKVTAFNFFGLAYARAQSRARDLGELEAVYLEYGRRFGDLVLRQNFAGEGIYALTAAAAPIFQRAADLGKQRILEQISAPTHFDYQLVSEEEHFWPGWEPGYPGLAVWEARLELERWEWHHADAIICPSNFVAQGLQALGVDPRKIYEVPYGIELSRYDTPRRFREDRRPLRLLSVGTVSLRKGPQYFFQALGQLNTSLVQARFVGPVAIREPYRRLLAKSAEVTGRVPRGEVRRHYEWADVLVFPSLCEGSATVTYEALAAGLPVITTPNSGSVVRDGVEGFIVPIRDAEAIANRIERLARDRELWAWMSQNARQRAQEFSWEKYGERLVEAIVIAFSKKL